MATRVLFDIPVMRGTDVLTNPAAGAAVTVVGADSGKVFASTNTDLTTYTLPAVALGKGKMWWFFLTNTTGTMAVASTAANMIMNDATNVRNTCGADAGCWCFVVGDGTSYYCFEGYGTWTAGA
jgi:hypothetical protein